MVNNGNPANRVDIVFLGDGYTQANLNAGLYTSHIQNYLNHMFAAPGFLADPFPRYHKFFNVHKINVVSSAIGRRRSAVPTESIATRRSAPRTTRKASTGCSASTRFWPTRSLRHFKPARESLPTFEW